MRRDTEEAEQDEDLYRHKVPVNPAFHRLSDANHRAWVGRGRIAIVRCVLRPDRTLRRHRSAFVDVVNQGSQPIDLSQIPSAAIGHIEVLRDGASAQYGSDAIAGVINILLDDSADDQVLEIGEKRR